jgi:tRNA-specific 2-thiouridylase
MNNVLFAEDFNAIAIESLRAIPSSGMRVRAKIRYNAPERPATVFADSSAEKHERIKVEFDEPQKAIAKGQAVVLYDYDEGDVVIGGAIIC